MMIKIDSYFSKKFAILVFFALFILAVSINSVPSASANEEAEEKSMCSSIVGDVYYEDISKSDHGNDVRDIKEALKHSEVLLEEEFDYFMKNNYMALPDIALADISNGGTRIGYGLTVGDGEVFTISAEKDNLGNISNVSLFKVSREHDGSFTNNPVAKPSTVFKKNYTGGTGGGVGNCPVNKTWHCKKSKGKDCVEKNCARCTYLLHWKAVIACAAIACPYIVNYTCCESGECVPRMIRP